VKSSLKCSGDKQECRHRDVDVSSKVCGVWSLVDGGVEINLHKSCEILLTNLKKQRHSTVTYLS